MLGLGCIAVAALLSLPATAAADSVGVQVTARVTPVFTLTLLSDGNVSFGNVAAGKYYAAPERQTIRVSSGRPWDFTDSSDTVIRDLGGTDYVRSTLVRHSTSTGFGTMKPAGVYDITCRYVLDLSSLAAQRIPPGTIISTRMGYTVVQR